MCILIVIADYLQRKEKREKEENGKIQMRKLAKDISHFALVVFIL